MPAQATALGFTRSTDFNRLSNAKLATLRFTGNQCNLFAALNLDTCRFNFLLPRE